jgi:hypothetical protein
MYAGLLESAASEHASRQRAMKAATDNAGEIIEDLTREANAARQAAITTEISEIVGGAEALPQVTHEPTEPGAPDDRHPDPATEGGTAPRGPHPLRRRPRHRRGVPAGRPARDQLRAEVRALRRRGQDADAHRRGRPAHRRRRRPRDRHAADRRRHARHHGAQHRGADLRAGRPGDPRPPLQRARRAARRRQVGGDHPDTYWPIHRAAPPSTSSSRRRRCSRPASRSSTSSSPTSRVARSACSAAPASARRSSSRR